MQENVALIKEINTMKILKNMVAMNAMQSKSKELQEHYPEIAYKVMIINAGFLFTGLWNVIKLFLNKLTQEKIIILGNNYIPELMKHTTLDKLPVSIGGSCTHDINSHPNFFDAEYNRSISERHFQLKALTSNSPSH